MIRLQKLKYVLPLIAGFAIASHADTEIYRSVDDSGNTSYSDRQPHASQRVTEEVTGRVNVYSDPQRQQQNAQTEVTPDDEDTLHDLSTGDDDANVAIPKITISSEKLNEKRCQEIYGLDCDRVINWKKYAREKCGSDERCRDATYLDRKYRPRPLNETLKIAIKAGTRKNRKEDEERQRNRE